MRKIVQLSLQLAKLGALQSLSGPVIRLLFSWPLRRDISEKNLLFVVSCNTIYSLWRYGEGSEFILDGSPFWVGYLILLYYNINSN